VGLKASDGRPLMAMTSSRYQRGGRGKRGISEGVEGPAIAATGDWPFSGAVKGGKRKGTIKCSI
jgi:hypothetical protein